ncbi:hypothetical protein Tco_1255946 [Tanacetum coccineum]
MWPISIRNRVDRFSRFGRFMPDLADFYPINRNTGKFAWTPLVGTVVPLFVMERRLKAYPLVEPKVQKKRGMNTDQKRALKEKMIEWLKVGTIRKVQYPVWIANAIPIQQKDGSWRVHTDFASLNKVCPKDMYPFPEAEEKLESLMRAKELWSYIPKVDEWGVHREDRRKYENLLGRDCY